MRPSQTCIQTRGALWSAGCLIVVAVLAASFSAAATTIGPDSPGCMVATQPTEIGLSEVSRAPGDSRRVLDLTLQSKAMGGEQHVNVLLPEGYDPEGKTRYPVLYLLHGAFGTYKDYVTHGIEKLVGKRKLIVVMPDDGPDGSYSDWFGTFGGLDRAPMWETFHVRELIAFIDATFRTTRTREGRFIAGISSGGNGAMKYAAAHPGLFGAAGEFSGAVDTELDYPNYPTISEGLWLLTLIPGMGPYGQCTWGDPYTQRVIWADNNPTSLAGNLKGTALYLATGDGDPGPLDEDGASWDPTEYEVGMMNQSFAKALATAGIQCTADKNGDEPCYKNFYGDGTHTWPYWEREFGPFLEWLDERIAAPAAPPDVFSYRSARKTFEAWDWRFTVHRDVREFVYLRDVSSGGFGVTGSGALDVATAPIYRAGKTYLVTAGGGPRRELAGSDNRLRFTLDLGPSHQIQQYRFGAGATARWTSLQVSIAPTQR